MIEKREVEQGDAKKVDHFEHLKEKTLSSREIYNGAIIQVSVEDVQLPNGKTSKREIVKHPGAVAIIALTAEKKLVLVRQYRKPLDRVIYEIPAGKLEKGEQPIDCVKRELEEETGYTSNCIKHVQSFYTSPGFADEIVHLYYTDSLEKLEKSLQLDADEFLDKVEVTFEEARQLVENQEILDAKTAFAVQYIELQLCKGAL